METKGRALLGFAAGLLCLTASEVTVQAAEGGREVPHYDIREVKGTWDETNYYLPDGTMVTDAFFCDGTDTYYLQADGTAMKDRLTYHPDGEHVIYFDVDGHEVFDSFAWVGHNIPDIETGIATELNEYCYFGSEGYQYTDVLTYGNEATGTAENLLYANQYGILERNGWFQFSETVSTPWGNNDGVAGGYGYAKENGTLMADEYTYWNGNLVYMEAAGYMRVSETPGSSENGEYTERWDHPFDDGWNIWVYDSAGQCLKFTSYDADGNIEWWVEYGYDNAGNSIKDTAYNADGSIKWWTEYEYDSAGNLIKRIDYNADGSIEGWSESEYDSAGNLIKRIFYNADSSIESWSEYGYDSAGNCIKDISYNSDGSIEWWYEYEYDSAGNRIKDMTYNADGSIQRGIESEYDSAGNCIKDIFYNSDGSRDEYKYEYDSAGKCIKRISYDVNGNIERWNEYEYDSNGNRVKDTTYNADGSIANWSEYDSTGALIKSITYNADGSWRESESDGFSLIKDITYNADGSISKGYENIFDSERTIIKTVFYGEGGSVEGWWEYMYDSNGNCIGEIRYNADGSISYVNEY